MRNFLHFTASGLRRTVLAPSFVGAAVGQCALSLLSVYDEMTLVGADSTASYLYEMGIYANFWVLFLLFGAIPGATLFCTDWENRYIRFSAARAGKAAYGAGTAAACYLAGTGAVFVGEWLFFGALCLGYPLLSPGSTAINSWMGTPFAPLLTPQRILLFYAARFLIKACCAGAICAAALAILPLFVERAGWWMHYISPVSWASLSVVDLTGTTAFPSLGYVLAVLAGGNALLALLAFLAMGRRDIDVLKSV